MPKVVGYFGAAAQLMAIDRRARDRKLIKYPDLCKRVIERIKDGWTPEQIGNRMMHERAKPRVCQETIYRYIYSKDGMRDDLWWYLPTIALPVGQGEPADAANPNSTKMSISCSVRMMWLTAQIRPLGR